MTTDNGPGAALVVLRRQPTSTDVMLVPSQADGAALPCAAARDGSTQWALAEDLLSGSRLDDVGRLYASTLSVQHQGDALGLFVAFLDGGGADGPPPEETHWMDLREACRELAPVWAGALSAVRERFIARPPDEALRIR